LYERLVRDHENIKLAWEMTFPDEPMQDDLHFQYWQLSFPLETILAAFEHAKYCIESGDDIHNLGAFVSSALKHVTYQQ